MPSPKLKLGATVKGCLLFVTVLGLSFGTMGFAAASPTTLQWSLVITKGGPDITYQGASATDGCGTDWTTPCHVYIDVVKRDLNRFVRACGSDTWVDSFWIDEASSSTGCDLSGPAYITILGNLVDGSGNPAVPGVPYFVTYHVQLAP